MISTLKQTLIGFVWVVSGILVVLVFASVWTVAMGSLVELMGIRISEFFQGAWFTIGIIIAGLAWMIARHEPKTISKEDMEAHEDR